ncbi:MAG: hypothetical protein IPK33_12665 [Gemmatimonadetes bacterium]|nr:hypothetical protein [Gemmatimonadota bacterium]
MPPTLSPRRFETSSPSRVAALVAVGVAALALMERFIDYDGAGGRDASR